MSSSPLYRRGNRGTEQGRDLPKITQQASVQARVTVLHSLLKLVLTVLLTTACGISWGYKETLLPERMQCCGEERFQRGTALSALEREKEAAPEMRRE